MIDKAFITLHLGKTSYPITAHQTRTCHAPRRRVCTDGQICTKLWSRDGISQRNVEALECALMTVGGA